MEWRNGDMIDVCREVGANGIVFTANSVVSTNDCLVMGAGAAQRVRDAFPKSIQRALGAQIKQSSPGVQPDYHFVGVTLPMAKQPDLPFYIFALQVKRHYAEPGDLALTVESLEALNSWCRANPDVKLVMNCPLIGLGGFASQIDKVKSIVEGILSDTNVIVTIL